MIYYCFIVLILLLYFELLGRSINGFLKIKNLPFNFVTGFFFILSLGYVTTSILTAINCKFFIVLTINTILLIFGLLLIVLNRKHLEIHFNIFDTAFLVLSALVLSYYTYNTTLGDLHGFDSVHYLNLVTGPINSTEGLFGFDVKYGYNGKEMAVYAQYSFTTYYTFVSTILFYLKSLFTLLGKGFFYNTTYIWVFQFLFHFSLVSIVSNSIKTFDIKCKPFIVLIWIFIVFYIGKIYFYNIYGFFGNSFRIISTSYLSLYTILLFTKKEKKYLVLIACALLSGCSFTSSFLFFVYIYLFAFVLVFIEFGPDLIKWVSLVILFPSINLISMIFWYFSIQKCILISLLITLIIYISNSFLNRLLNAKYIRQIIVLLLSFAMFYMSFEVTKDVFDFSAFFDNNSEIADMTLNYFSLGSYKIIKLTTLVGLGLYSLFFSKQKIAMISWILIIALFNPFCCSYFNSINAVYYRSYDLIVNPLLIIYYYNSLLCKINKKNKYFILTFIISIFMLNINYLEPNYYHESFIPEENNYDHINKMKKTDIDIIIELNNCINKNSINNPRIASPNILTFSSIGKGNYLFGREYKYSEITDDNLLQVLKICYPVNYFGEVTFPEADYRNIYKYLKNGKVDILVLSNKLDIYDEEKNVFYPLRNVVEWGSLYPEYENEDYAIYLVR